VQYSSKKKKIKKSTEKAVTRRLKKHCRLNMPFKTKNISLI